MKLVESKDVDVSCEISDCGQVLELTYINDNGLPIVVEIPDIDCDDDELLQKLADSFQQQFEPTSGTIIAATIDYNNGEGPSVQVFQA